MATITKTADNSRLIEGYIALEKSNDALRERLMVAEFQRDRARMRERSALESAESALRAEGRALDLFDRAMASWEGFAGEPGRTARIVEGEAHRLGEGEVSNLGTDEKGGAYVLLSLRCSECGRFLVDEESSYCPDCGARLVREGGAR